VFKVLNIEPSGFANLELSKKFKNTVHDGKVAYGRTPINAEHAGPDLGVVSLTR
jgi:hypothetical protein